MPGWALNLLETHPNTWQYSQARLKDDDNERCVRFVFIDCVAWGHWYIYEPTVLDERIFFFGDWAKCLQGSGSEKDNEVILFMKPIVYINTIMFSFVDKLFWSWSICWTRNSKLLKKHDSVVECFYGWFPSSIVQKHKWWMKNDRWNYLWIRQSLTHNITELCYVIFYTLKALVQLLLCYIPRLMGNTFHYLISNNCLNFIWFLTQSSCITSENSEYSAWVIWTTFMIN